MSRYLMMPHELVCDKPYRGKKEKESSTPKIPLKSNFTGVMSWMVMMMILEITNTGKSNPSNLCKVLLDAASETHHCRKTTPESNKSSYYKN